MRTIAAAFIVLLSAAPAFAQKAAPADAKAIEACLAKAESDGKPGFNCVGAIADPCIESAKGTNTDVESWKKCAARELAVWTGLMAKALQGVGKGGPKGADKATGAAQAAFLESVKALCPVFDVIEPGMVPGGANYCRLQETARRTILL